MASSEYKEITATDGHCLCITLQGDRIIPPILYLTPRDASHTRTDFHPAHPPNPRAP